MILRDMVTHIRTTRQMIGYKQDAQHYRSAYFKEVAHSNHLQETLKRRHLETQDLLSRLARAEAARDTAIAAASYISGVR